MGEDADSRPAHALTRRGLLAGAAAVGAVPLLAGHAGAAARKGGLTPAEVKQLKELLGPINPKYSGRGTTWKIGSLLALSGAGNYYGIGMGNGVKLAVEHIGQLGGPKIAVDFRDHASGDPQKGIKASIAFHAEKLPAVLTSYGGDLGAAIPLVKRYKMLAIDQGGGNAPPFDRKPYFFGMRASQVTDYPALEFAYIKKYMPKLKTLVIIFPDLGPVTKTFVDGATKLAAAQGLKVVGVVKPKWGATDFSAEIAAVRAQPSDFIWDVGVQLDEAYFMKQYKVSGINRPIFGVEYVGPTAKVAGSAFDGMYFAQDDFNPVSPSNPWASVFVRDYRATFGDNGFPQATPDFYSAGYYQATFVLWFTMMRVLAKKGNPNDGAQLQAQLLANPRFPSVFGGSSSKPGVLEFDPVTHGLKHQPIGIYQVRANKPVKLAEGDIGGKSLRLVGK